MGEKSEPAGRIVSATEASRSFSALLDRVERGERFVVERHGKSICVMAPPQADGRRASECLVLLRDREPVLLDDRFGDDLLDVINAEPKDSRPWDS